MQTLRRLTPVHWGWLVFKIVLGLGWTHAMFLSTPQSIASEISVEALLIWVVGTSIGAIISLVGMLMSVSTNRRKSLRGLTVELIGIVLFAGGPFQYLAIQLSFFPDRFTERYALAWFAFAMLTAIGVRFVDVGGKFIKEAFDPNKKVR